MLMLMVQRNGTPEPAGYEQAMPDIQARVKKYEAALAKARLTHGGSMEEVREALAEAFEAEGLTVWKEVADDAARLIAGEDEPGPAAG
ncbi:hypothetical protein KBX37_32595 [Micromonospora sp. U56]|uniref:hypothetical protein n=1 Tax=Micromonospora sp. U56 TaxID=2824900 RepID=UPI001B397BFB|nr:hypothetical protein [Micromonospora sp. U56]MBQ0897736.1 hypothetical protein [Micromonospora sp. U56]